VGTLLERRSLIAVAAAAIAFSVSASLLGEPVARLFPEAVRITAMFAFAAALGDATRNRRAYVAEVEERAAEAERSRDEVARRRVEEERLRIARELHDVTAHSLSIIAVQAGAAQRVIASDPDAAKRALETIRTTSKSSLDELRAILGVLRGTDDGVQLAPAGSVDRLGELAATLESAGVRVDMETRGVENLPAYADVSAYRIVQEALTNVVRHSGAHRASVSLVGDADSLLVEVTDDRRDLRSMVGPWDRRRAKRIVALGGQFSAGPDRGRFPRERRIPLVGGRMSDLCHPRLIADDQALVRSHLGCRSNRDDLQVVGGQPARGHRVREGAFACRADGHSNAGWTGSGDSGSR
jgi:glucose-6-phosphate-specific signal transduction histidine kinase